MRRNRISALTAGSALFTILMLQGCAANEEREQRVADERPKCHAGETLSCHASSTGRISDGRFGRRGGRSQFCSCQPDSDLARMRGADLPSEPR